VPPPGYVEVTRPEPPPPPTRVPRQRPRFVAAVVVLALAAGLAFVVFGSTSSQLTDPIAQAAAFSSNTPGYRIRMSMEIASSQLASPITASGNGIVDLRDHAASMSLALNLGSDPQAIQVLGSNTMQMRMIIDGAVLYFKLPAAVTASLPVSGKQWLKLDVAKFKSLPGLSSLGRSPTMQDPSHMLQALESTSSNTLNEGKQYIDGSLTTHYRAYLNLRQLASNLTASQQAAAQQAISMLEQATKSQDLPVDVWVDPYGFVRRMVMKIDLALPNGGSAQETISADLSDYGPQRRPAAPPSDQVQDIGSLIHIGG
jgi:hypothetical protein